MKSLMVININTKYSDLGKKQYNYNKKMSQLYEANNSTFYKCSQFDYSKYDKEYHWDNTLSTVVNIFMESLKIKFSINIDLIDGLLL